MVRAMKRTPEALDRDVARAEEYSRRCWRAWRRRERRVDGFVRALAVVATLMAYGALVCAATVVWLG